METNPTEPFQDAFKAGVKSAEPNPIIEGVFSHHKDVTITDKYEAVVREKKQNDSGPGNPRAIVTLHTPEAMKNFFHRFKESRTIILANAETKTIATIIDFQEESKEERSVAEDTGWGQFRGVLALKTSRKLKEWEKATEWMGQSEFANFLEDHLEDVRNPSGADMLSIATDLEANSTGSFKGKVNLQNGDVRLDYQSDTQTSIELPKIIELGIPLFEHGDKYLLKARLRYRVGGGGVAFKLIFTNLIDAVDAEFERLTQAIEESTMPILRGTTDIYWDKF